MYIHIFILLQQSEVEIYKEPVECSYLAAADLAVGSAHTDFARQVLCCHVMVITYFKDKTQIY